MTTTYGPCDAAPGDIPKGHERISVVTDDRSGMSLYQVETADGGFYLCDGDGDVVNTVSSWTLRRILADVPADDSDAFFEAIEATAE